MIKNINKLLLFIFVFVVTFASAQTTTSSPYSKYGVGEIRPKGFSQNLMMGGIGVGVRSSRNINFINPAALTAIQLTNFDVSITRNSVWMQDANGQSQYVNNTFINNLAFAFPVVKNHWVASFGLKPFSSVGYDYETRVTDANVGDVDYYYTGSGGLNQFFVGNGLGLNLDTTSTLSGGFNFMYIFGDYTNDQKTIFGNLPNGLNIWELNELTVGSAGIDFGLQYQKRFVKEEDDDKLLTFGAVFNTAKNLKAKRSRKIRSFVGNEQFGTVRDTIVYEDGVKDTVQMPLELGFGLSYEKEKKWMLGADFIMSNWSDIKSKSTLFTFKSNYQFALGFQLTPDYNAFNKYLKMITYAAGFRVGTSNFAIANEQLNEYAVSLGVALPLKRASTAVPKLNFGIEYGTRGNTSNNLIKEDFVNINLGVAINDRWFIKRRYD